MHDDGGHKRWVRLSIGSLVVITIVSLLVGFVWLPSVHADFTAKGLWDSICRAAGVPVAWGERDIARGALPTTRVVLLPEMGRASGSEAVGRGGTLALQQCTMCHGARGESAANAPNLAGQYPEVIVKQLIDYQHGNRVSSVMQALASSLGERDMRDIAAYYYSLPRGRITPVVEAADVPALVKVGDPMRNIAPCATCHGGIDRKLGAPWMEGMPREYLIEQLDAFAKGTRRNDSHAQMRNMARSMTRKEIDEVASFYARHPEGASH